MLEDEQLNNQGGFSEAPEPPPLNKNQKIAAASLAVFAVLIVALWAAQLKNNIYGPFNKPAGKNQAVSQAQTSDEALKTKDTDGDGLSDYDELNLYKTSPYLEDTDGDGLKDGEEIKNGADPNCPKGRTCSGLEETPTAGQATSTLGASVLPNSGLNNLTNQNDAIKNNLLNQFGATNPTNLPAPNQQNSAANLNNDQLQALKNIDAASLRQLLIQKGMPKETLDKISDEELMKSYSEVLQ